MWVCRLQLSCVNTSTKELSELQASYQSQSGMESGWVLCKQGLHEMVNCVFLSREAEGGHMADPFSRSHKDLKPTLGIPGHSYISYFHSFRTPPPASPNEHPCLTPLPLLNWHREHATREYLHLKVFPKQFLSLFFFLSRDICIIA